MRTTWQNAIRLKAVSRQALAAAAGLLLAAPAFKEQQILRGRTPLASCKRHLPASHAGLSRCNCGFRPDVCLWGRWIEPVLAGVLFGVGVAIAAVNFMAWPGLALSVRRVSDCTFRLERAMPNAKRVNTVYRSLSRPLTILGAERKLFFSPGASVRRLSICWAISSEVLRYFQVRQRFEKTPVPCAGH